MKAISQNRLRSLESGVAADRHAFEQRRGQLLRRYRGHYVSVSGGQVVGHGKHDENLAARMFEKFGNTPFFIARVEETPSFYEIPSTEAAG